MDNVTRLEESFLTLDRVSLIFFVLLTIIIVSRAPAVISFHVAVRDIALAASALVVSSVVVRRVRHLWIPATVRTLSVLLAYALLFPVAEKMQHVFVNGWLDDGLLRFEYALIGTESSVYLQRFVSPLVTEWMMFAYVIYIPLLPLTALAVFTASGEKAVHEYLLNLALAYSLCYLGFLVFPLATQMHHSPEMYTVRLEGWFFTWCGEWMRGNVHAPGAALPSPHCAAATVMLIMFFRYQRRLFYVVLPVILTLYVSTVYARYHYVWDSLAGMLVGVLVLVLSPKLVSWVAFRRLLPIAPEKKVKQVI